MNNLVEIKLAKPEQPNFLKNQKKLFDILEKYNVTPTIIDGKVFIDKSSFVLISSSIKTKHGYVIRRVLPNY